jgi:hypothetical protein
MRFKPRFQFVVRLLLAAVFAYASVVKAMDKSSAQSSPTIFSNFSPSSPIHWTVIGAEAFLAVWLVSGIEISAGSAVAIILLSVFTGILLTELTKDRPLPCGCSGAPKAVMGVLSVRRSLRIEIIRNLLMLIAASFLFLLPRASNAKAELSFSHSYGRDRNSNPT